jgi:hypothetical protein
VIPDGVCGARLAEELRNEDERVTFPLERGSRREPSCIASTGVPSVISVEPDFIEAAHAVGSEFLVPPMSPQQLGVTDPEAVALT